AFRCHRRPTPPAARVVPEPPARSHGPRAGRRHRPRRHWNEDRKSTRLNSSHGSTSYAVFCLKKKTVRVPLVPLPWLIARCHSSGGSGRPKNMQPVALPPPSSTLPGNEPSSAGDGGAGNTHFT